MIKLIARLFLAISGWKAEGQRPLARRFVLIAAPHTSNWDLVYLLAFASIFDLKLSFVAKQEIFRWPFGGLMRRVGGIPVRRDRRQNLVQQLAEHLQAASDMALTIPAEGTRSYVPHWKSGFYHIAMGASVPVVCGFLDYERRRGGFGPELTLSGHPSDDMEPIRDFYSGVKARYPDLAGEIRLKEEQSSGQQLEPRLGDAANRKSAS